MDDARLLSWIETGQIVATLLVAIGVAGEFAGTFISRPISRRLDAKREAEMATLRSETAAAQLRAAELEALIQPRYLTKAQEGLLTGSMRPFAGRGMIIASQWIDAEAARLAVQIKAALTQAGIGTDQRHLDASTVDKIGAYPELSTGTWGGGGGFARQNIHTGVEIWGSDRAAVSRLADSLRSDGKLQAVVTPESKEPFDNLYGPISLIIFVGSKPVRESRRNRLPCGCARRWMLGRVRGNNKGTSKRKNEPNPSQLVLTVVDGNLLYGMYLL